MVEKSAEHRQRRAADTARWRERQRHGQAICPVVVSGEAFDLMEKFGLLAPESAADKRAVSIALSKLLGRALEALLREEAARLR